MDITTITNAVKNAANVDGLKQRWSAWSAKPENRAFLLQAGTSLLNGPVPGQSQWSQFGNAIAQGAEARDRNIQAGIDRQTQQTDMQAKKDTLQLNKDELQLRKDQLNEQRANNASLQKYRENMGLSSLLRAKQPKTGRSPKTIEEAWMTHKSKLLEDASAIGEKVTPEWLGEQKKLFFENYQAMAADGGVGVSADSTEGDPLVEGGTYDTPTGPQMWKNGQWIPLT